MVCWKVISALGEKLKVEPCGEPLSAGAGPQRTIGGIGACYHFMPKVNKRGYLS